MAFDKLSNPATLDVNTENEDVDHYPLVSHTSQKGDRRHQQEVAPLLSQERYSFANISEDSYEDDEELASPPIVNNRSNMSGLLNKFFYCCFQKRQTKPQNNRRKFIVACIFIILLPLIAFIISCTVYFSPLPLPTNTIPLKNVALLQHNVTQPRLLTFNMFMRPPGVKNNKDDLKMERLNYIVQHILPSYDIITIQEAFAYANRRIDTFLAAAFQQGFYYHVSSKRHYPWDLAGDGGLLILSRFPIQKSDRIEFPRGVHADWLSFKGALHALVELDSKHLIHVYTTHTQASYDDQGAINFDDTKVRLSQFAAVHQFIADTANNDTYPILLMGDLNVDAAVHDGPIDNHSYNSSLAYNMMVDVLTGRGTNLTLIDKSEKQGLSYSSDWSLSSLTDVVYQKYGYHPVTFGDYKTLQNGTLVPAETLLTSHNQLMSVQSIDRMFWVNNRSSNMSLHNITVEKFLVNNKTAGLPFTQISGNITRQSP